MQVIATHRYARISAFKAREVTREIQGLPAIDALQQLGFIPKTVSKPSAEAPEAPQQTPLTGESVS